MMHKLQRVFLTIIVLVLVFSSVAASTSTADRITTIGGVGAQTTPSTPAVGTGIRHTAATGRATPGHPTGNIPRSATTTGCWSVVPSPNPGTYNGYLSGVTAISPSDVWAVGYYDSGSYSLAQTLTEHWNGTSWSGVPNPNPGPSGNWLSGVTAISSSDVWAVGEHGISGGPAQTLTEHWNGSSWSVVPSPSPGTGNYGNHLYGVTAISVSDVWAVGDYHNGDPSMTLTEHWDGSSWSVVPSLNPGLWDNHLQGVTAISSNDVWAVDWYTNNYINSPHQTLTEHWNGSSWSVVPSPNVDTGDNELLGVAAISPSDVWAVGYYKYTSGNTYRALTEHWDGSSWSVAPNPNPNPGTGDYRLLGVAAISSNDVWAVGDYYNGNLDRHMSLTEHYSTSRCNTPIGWWETLGGFNFCVPCLLKAMGSWADPVNTATGNFHHTFSDFAIPGRGMPLNFSHTYNSLTANRDGPLGFGWTGSYGMSLSVDPGTGVVTVTQETGSQVVFTPINQNNYTAPPRVIATLIRNVDGTYTLTRGGREIITFSAAGQLLADRDLNGYTTTYTYNGNGQLATVTDAAGRPLTLAYSGSHIASISDPIGRQELFGYNDGQGNLTDVTDVAGGNTHFTYDANHLMLTMSDPNGGVVTNHYDTAGRVDWQEDQLHRRTSFAYAPDASSTTITEPSGNVTFEQYQYGLRVAVTKGYGTPQAATWQYTYDPATLGIISTTDPDGHVTATTYDANANPLTVTDALGRQTVNTYDALNDLTSTTDPNGITTTMQYDAAGNLLNRSRPLVGSGQNQVTVYHYDDPAHPGDVTSMTDPNNQTWSYAYDTNGDLTSATDPLGDQTTYGFNAIGWKISQTSPLGNPGGEPAYTTTFDHDAFGDVTTVTDPLQHRTISHYDPNRNLDTFTDANSHVTHYGYDAANQLTSVVRPDTVTLRTDYNPDGTIAHQYDGAGRANSYGYNSLAQVISVTDPLSRTTSYTYDGVGNMLTKTDPQSPPQTTSYTYDAANQLTAITYSDGVTPNVSNIAYDGNGQRLQMTDGSGTSTWAYDSLNRLTSATDGAGSTVAYGYDLKNQLTGITYPGAQLVSRNYDAAGRLHTVQDWLGNVTTFRYDRNSNLVRENLPPGTGITDKFAYDTTDRLIGIRYSKSGTAQATIFYSHDPVDLLTTMTSTGALNNNETYGYTPVNQLHTVNSASYAYDNADNITALTSGASLQYDAANELTSLTHNSSTTTFNFDPRGNRTSMIPPSDPATNYSYDQANRLTAYSTASVLATYTYNGDGLRMSKTVAGVAEPFVWDVAEGLPLLLMDGTTSYVYGPGGLPLEQISAAGAVLYYHHDQLGSIRLLTNASGAVAATYTYDAYGNLTASTGNVANPFGYEGQYTDAESGLQYLRARYYDPSTAQFISRDPLVSVTRQPYSYGGESPINYTDPTGMINIASLNDQQRQQLVDTCSAWSNQGLCYSAAFCSDATQCAQVASAFELAAISLRIQHQKNLICINEREMKELTTAADVAHLTADYYNNKPGFIQLLGAGLVEFGGIMLFGGARHIIELSGEEGLIPLMAVMAYGPSAVAAAGIPIWIGFALLLLP